MVYQNVCPGVIKLNNNNNDNNIRNNMTLTPITAAVVITRMVMVFKVDDAIDI